MANDKKPAEGGKAPAKVETINLKVFIHCEGCKKKVKKILNNVEGVHTVDVDGSLGKVTVTGTVDSKTLIKKLEKAGKVAEVLASGKGKEQQKDQQKGENKEAKEEKSGGGEGDKKGKGGGGGGGGGGNGEGDKKGQGNNNGGGDSNNNKGNNSGGGSANNGESGKKKKGGGGDGGNGGDELGEAGPNKNTANKNIAPIMVETGYSSMESAEYATHIFSDENANNCHIM